jgi:hypothetical protein
VETIVPDQHTAETQAKVAAEIAKIRAETSALKAIGDQTRWWTTVLTAIGSLIGAIIGGILTFVVTRMGQRFSRLQMELEDSRSERDRLRREGDERLAREKIAQETEQAQELHNLRLFQDLGHQSHRARLAAAAVLLHRLRMLNQRNSVETDAAEEAQLIGKVLVAVLKRQTTVAEQPTSDASTVSAAAITPESELNLRKYIADELVGILGVRFEPNMGPTEFGKSLLGQDRDFQKCDLANVLLGVYRRAWHRLFSVELYTSKPSWRSSTRSHLL